ncbi:MAG: hypothetical protein KF871_17065 [Hydrogenophaga sp.]|uniref:hypothetical protein n=1 Tax=Hydrogenophaga sp. TaxID=1904254 RepID=UPI001DCD32A5|nr:hypothetical protein [Hydrogenophaga sp.]MBX3611608.1 hypothetical protein [Hydrogenophaga sp.]
MSIQPHDYALARATAEQLRQEAWQELWRDADAVWARVSHDAAERLARSGNRWRVRLAAHRARRERTRLVCG